MSSASELWLYQYLEDSIIVAGSKRSGDGLQTYLISRDYVNLKSEFQLGNGKVCLLFTGFAL